ncbi:MAG: ABC transporter permease, partial [Candidatus Aminicenantaceae bacterium]
MAQRSRRPPSLARAILRRFSPPHLEETLTGDHDEMFSLMVERYGSPRAAFWYWRQVPQAFLFSFYWGGIMFANTIKTALRTINKNKSFSLINISGLALGIACCILILLWIQDELSWDRFHENSKSIFRIVQKQHDGHLTPVTPDALALHLKAEYPEVVNAARYKYLNKIQLQYGDNSFAERPLVADPSYFDVFSFPFIQGDPLTALSDPRSIALSQELALKLFGQEDPIGKTLLVNNQSSLIVTGILENVPRNSSLKFNCVLPFQLLTQGRTDNNWTSNSTWTYVQLRDDVSGQDVESRISGLVSDRDPQNKAQLRLQPLARIHLNPQDQGGPILYVYIFSAMAIFILVIACINFINLTTARSSLRAREVGLRKVVGARRGNLIRQFFGESFLFTLVAVLAAVLLVGLFFPVFNNLSGKDFVLGRDLFGNQDLLLGILGIVVLTGLLSGGYPALLLSSFQPVTVLRASKNFPGQGRSFFLRKILVIVQYSIAIFLMIGTFVIYRQLDFIQSRDLGFDKELVVCSDSRWGEPGYQVIKSELLKHPNIHSVSFTSQRMGDWESGAREDVIWEGKSGDPKLTFEVIFCDPDFLETHGMELLQGRFFSDEMQSDQGESFVLNQAAVRAMEFGEESPLGKSLSFWGSYRGNIIGVIKDFHTQSLHSRIQPVILAYAPRMLDVVNIRIGPGDIPNTLGFLETKWKELNSGFSFDYWFLDESLEVRYRAEQATGTLLKYFTFLAIFISCIGLLGLIAFVSQQRTKEVGIRKVMGASVASILRLLVKESVVLVLLANVIAWPTAYFFLKKWLENFAYRTGIGLHLFFLSGGLALIIALSAVSLQALKAAGAN